MSGPIDMIWLGGPAHAPAWSVGETWSVAPIPSAIGALIQQKLPTSEALAWLFWHPDAGLPDPTVVLDVVTRPGNLWHAGLNLGMQNQPGLIDFVMGTWMFSCDPDPNIEATSWRLSLRACLVQVEVLRELGGINPAFTTLEAAGLDMGHRYLTRGALMRHIPQLVLAPRASTVEARPALAVRYPLPFEDELRFVRCRFSQFWANWALMRAVLSGYVSPRSAWRAWSHVRSAPRPPEPSPYRHPVVPSATAGAGQAAETPPGVQARVTVLVPTVDRYPYLRVLLKQLRQQTVAPHEIIVIDQTEVDRRDVELSRDFSDLPLKWIYLDQAGQCSSRNTGLRASTGDYILFLDDDDEVPVDLIEAHLRRLDTFGVNVSSGVADEVGAGRLPDHFKYTRSSDVFPTNNTLIRREILDKSGLFDLAYEKMSRADGDLGMRLYLSGAFMLLSPEISVLHHHAPRGGLRKHKARVVTYASSRHSLVQRQLPSVSEIYLAMRYFTPRQVRESLWINAFSTLSARGSKGYRLLKAMMGCA
ncbi:MAG TPA: glycosyltransferase family A protein, partial [Aggregatilineaceae bacterium]|nr:glycosyltransferase family A protein [Aggregatilineaceae bacterium]